MLIDTHQTSPNYDERTLPLSMLVLHYTGMESGEAALQRLCDAQAKVSAHYLVHEDGRVQQLVDEAHRAWHAGIGSWRGIRDVNSASIGIEIVNGGHNFPDVNGAPPAYPDVQINAVIALCHEVIKRHNIRPWNVIGHSDLAPGRKEDPGEHFPWAGLAAAGIGLWFQEETAEETESDKRVLFELGDRDRGVSVVQQGLAQLGYDVAITGQFDETTSKAMRAFQRRWRPDDISGFVDMDCLQRIGALVWQLP
ncbi:N-acetylmuramoyl-L-alanine amidase [Litorimonas taeanensis]|uniref:N-acetylmuramoyl-L-alanine amidase n=1 Tax=Litorimonas taeanensis TaxID=568099 RepID=A0A420WL29_9PROT|nr:N-acetylmuramoyl-L-alanine amidase [Litorimonas taeanensis]RKQ71728.1 N-acetylmuramoyl-L-alanine amidase [Litorimonas taeanensis]